MSGQETGSQCTEEDLGRSTIHNVPKPWVFGPNFLGRLTQTIAVLNMTPHCKDRFQITGDENYLSESSIFGLL
jgi:hypothetical protein